MFNANKNATAATHADRHAQILCWGVFWRHFNTSITIIIEGSNNKQSVLMIMSIETITVLWEADNPPPRKSVKSAELGLWPSVGEKFTDEVF